MDKNIYCGFDFGFVFEELINYIKNLLISIRTISE